MHRVTVTRQFKNAFKYIIQAYAGTSSCKLHHKFSTRDSIETLSLNMMNCETRRAQMDGDRQRFLTALPKMIDLIIQDACAEIKDAMDHFRQSAMYNVQGGKLNRGMTVLHTWRLLSDNKETTGDDLESAIILAWCVELLQSSFLVADDIMDQSKTRRGKLCWYKREEVGLIAVNDSLMLEGCLYKLIDKQFFGRKCYPNIVRLLHQVTFQTETGQTLDLITKPGEKFTNFTLERYKAIVKWKTAFYSFYLPVALAMYLVDITDENLHAAAKEILLQMGEFFQIQDDYLDCFGDPEVTGKVGTDIEDTKCSWLLVQALQRVNEDQMKILEANYGINDSKAVANVKDVYRQLAIETVYKTHEEQSYKTLMEMVDRAPLGLPKDIFSELAKKIYRRDK